MNSKFAKMNDAEKKNQITLRIPGVSVELLEKLSEQGAGCWPAIERNAWILCALEEIAAGRNPLDRLAALRGIANREAA